MADFKPNTPYNVAAHVLTPITRIEKGVRVKGYDVPTEENQFFCSFRTFGGTEKVVNDVIVVEDTATLETWYNPMITSDCAILIDGRKYEILGRPENIGMRNQFMLLKVRAIEGGA